MAISFVALGANAKATSGNISPGLPSGWSANDIHICTIVAKDNINCTMTNWTVIDAGTNNGAGLRTTCFYRIAQQGDTAPTVTHTSGSYISANITGWRGVDTTNPIDVIGSTSVNGSSTTVTATAITTLQNNAMVIFTGGIASRSTFGTYSGSPTPTERQDAPNTVNYPSNFVANFLLVTAGTTSNRTCTASSGNVNNGLLFSLRLAKIETLKDDFNDNSFNTNKWVNNGGSQVVETNQQLQISSTTDGYYYVNSLGTAYDLIGSYASCSLELVYPSATETNTAFELADAGNYLTWVISEGTLIAQYYIGSTTVLNSTSYNPTNHKWLRIRENGGITYWDYSSNGTNWTNFASVANPFTLTTLFVELSISTWGNPTVNIAKFDNFNTSIVTKKNIIDLRKIHINRKIRIITR